jgi:hypothetical protein
MKRPRANDCDQAGPTNASTSHEMHDRPRIRVCSTFHGSVGQSAPTPLPVGLSPALEQLAEGEGLVRKIDAVMKPLCSDGGHRRGPTFVLMATPDLEPICQDTGKKMIIKSIVYKPIAERA